MRFVELVYPAPWDIDARYVGSEKLRSLKARNREKAQYQLRFGSLTLKSRFCFVEQKEEIFHVFYIKHRLGNDADSAVFYLLFEFFAQSRRIFGISVADGKRVDLFGSYLELLARIVDAGVEAFDDIKQQRAITFETPFGSGLVADFCRIARERQDSPHVEVVGSQQIGLEADFVAITHTHSGNHRLFEGLLQLQCCQDGVVFEARQGIVCGAKSVDLASDFELFELLYDRIDGGCVTRCGL